VAVQLRDLRRQAANGPRRRRDPHHVALAQPCDVKQAHVGGQARTAEDAQVRLRRCDVDVDPPERSDAAQVVRARRHDGVVPPAESVADDVAGLEVLGARLDHLADRHAGQRRVQPKRREVTGRPRRAHLEPHAGIDGAPLVAHEHLAVVGVVDDDFHKAEIGWA
jgi:hypothetical protein